MLSSRWRSDRAESAVAAAPLPLAEHGGDRRQQPRRVLQREAGRVGAERLDPARFGPQAQDPANIEEDPEQQDRQDHAVEPRIVLERGPDHLVQGADHGGDEHQEQERAVDEALRYHPRSRRLTIVHMPRTLPRAARFATGKFNWRLLSS